MKEIQTKSGKILCVEVPDDAYSIRFIPTGDLVYKVKDEPYQSLTNVMKGRVSITCKLIGKLSELTDKDCEEFVEFNYPFDGQYDKVFRNYLKLARNYLFNSAKESFISLLQSEGIDTGKEYLIIRIL